MRRVIIIFIAFLFFAFVVEGPIFLLPKNGQSLRIIFLKTQFQKKKFYFTTNNTKYYLINKKEEKYKVFTYD